MIEEFHVPDSLNELVEVVARASDGGPELGFTVAEGQIVEIDAIADPQRVRRIAAAVLADQ
jgi:hypothetical protein